MYYIKYVWDSTSCVKECGELQEVFTFLYNFKKNEDAGNWIEQISKYCLVNLIWEDSCANESTSPTDISFEESIKGIY